MRTQDATTFTSYATTTTHATKKELCGFALQFPPLCAESLSPLSFSPLECGRVERKEVKRKAKKERGFYLCLRGFEERFEVGGFNNDKLCALKSPNTSPELMYSFRSSFLRRRDPDNKPVNRMKMAAR